jgi:TonB family protein
MNFFSDPQEIASRFGVYVEDFHDVFRCNGVDFGSPEDFFTFARTMKYHTELRDDVMRVVKFVMGQETNISFRNLLTMIAVASGGPDVAKSDREMGTPVNLVIESMIGVGDCSQINTDQPDTASPELTAKEPTEAPVLERSSRSPAGKEATAQTAAQPVLQTANASSLDRTPPTSLPNGYSSPSNDDHGSFLHRNGHSDSTMLAESLSRLELNSLQLKIYLDSIDQRISRMEPRLENVPSAFPDQPRTHPRENPEARFSAAVPSASIPSPIPPTAVAAESEPPPQNNDSNRNNPAVPIQQVSPATEVSAAPEGTEATKAVAPKRPLVALTRPRTNPRQSPVFRKQRALPILVGIAMLLLAGSLFWKFGRDTGDVVVHPVNASMQNTSQGTTQDTGNAGGLSSPSAGPIHQSQVAAADDPSAVPASAAQGNIAAPTHRNLGEGVSHPPADTPTQTPKKSAQISSRSPLPLPSSSAADAETPAMATDASESTAEPDRTYKLSSDSSSTHLVNVSSGVMAANLLSDPKPSYPALASLTRTQGDVVMQVVISKNGTVEHLNVIQGHRLLRGAAKNAVRTWRYRPYKINGVPVEVTTIVSVDFSLHR